MLDRLMAWVLRPGVAAGLVLAQIGVGLAIALNVLELMRVSGGYGLLDFEFGYDAPRVAETFDAYGKAGMALFWRVQLLDLLNPALYALLGAALIYWLRQGSRWAWLALGAAALDYAENAVLAMLASGLPDVDAGLVGLGNVLSLAKHGVLGLSGGVVVFLAIQRVRRLRSP